MTIWTPLPGYPGYEVSDAGRMRSIGRQVLVPFRQARTLGTITAEEIAEHPHTPSYEVDSMGTIVPPTRIIGPTQVNVLTFGAVGDGSTDDTDAIQAAIDSLPTAGGTVYFPNGDYMIDVTKSINYRSHVRLLGDLLARLIAIPTAEDAYRIVYGEDVEDIEFDGLTLIGERDSHLGTGGEQGHCLLLLGCKRATIQRIHASKGWGDGLKFGGSHGNKVQSTDIILSNFVSTGNRRQGLSVTNANNVRCYDGELSDTNGTAPQCGLDIEPNAETSTGGWARDIYFENVIFKDNASSGAHIQRRAERVTFKDCSFIDNDRSGLEATMGISVLVEGCTIKGNAGVGLKASKESSYWTVTNNTFGENSGRDPRPVPFEKAGIVPKTLFDMTMNATNATVLTNRYE